MKVLKSVWLSLKPNRVLMNNPKAVKQGETPMLMKISMVLALLLALTWGQSLAADLKPGDAAPDFSLPGSDGKTYSLKQFKGKQVVVLAWFPKAFTGG